MTAQPPDPSCTPAVAGCVTCSDQAVEAEVTRLLGDATAEIRLAAERTAAASGAGAGAAKASIDQVVDEVSVGLVDARVGDVVLVHAGEAISVVRRSGVAGHATAALYPFLAGSTTGSSSAPPSGSPPSVAPSAQAAATGSDVAALLSDVQRSTVEKVHEIVRLRAAIDQADGERLAACAAAVASATRDGGRIFTFGNGGSSTDAQALASLFRRPGDGRPLPTVPAFALTADVAVVTALANDVGFDLVYARQLAAVGRPGDVAIGLSTSGNSENLLRGFGTARALGMVTVGLAGYDGGRMAECDDLDYLFVVDSSSVHRIQEAQTTIYHLLWELTVTAIDRR